MSSATHRLFRLAAAITFALMPAPPLLAQDADVADPPAVAAADAPHADLLRLVQPETVFIYRVDLTRIDEAEAFTWLTDAIASSPTEHPLQRKIATAMRRDGATGLKVFADAKAAGLEQVIALVPNPLAGARGLDSAPVVALKLREGADAAAVFQAIHLPPDFAAESAGKLLVIDFAGMMGVQRQVVAEKPSTRAEVLHALQAGGDEPLSILFVPAAGSLNAAKLAMPRLPDEWGAVQMAALTDGVEFVAFTAHQAPAMEGKAVVQCADPARFAEAVRALRKAGGNSLREGKIAGLTADEQKVFASMIDAAPDLVVGASDVRIELGEADARRLIDALIPSLADNFKRSAVWQSQQNLTVLLAAAQTYAAAHGGRAPATLDDLAPHLTPPEQDLAVLTRGVLDDRPLVLRRPPGGLLAPAGGDGSVLIHEELTDRNDNDQVAIGFASGRCEVMTFAEFKRRLAAGTIRFVDGAGRQAD